VSQFTFQRRVDSFGKTDPLQPRDFAGEAVGLGIANVERHGV
jgi:hypothetical protein